MRYKNAKNFFLIYCVIIMCQMPCVTINAQYVCDIIKISTPNIIEKNIINFNNYENPLRRCCEINSHFGWRKLFSKTKHHNGVDIDLKSGELIFAASDGYVMAAGWRPGYGNMVKIAHQDSIITLYCHLKEIYVRKNQIINKNTPIGTGGTTGRSTGPHLHFEIMWKQYYINPEIIFDFENDSIFSDYFKISNINL